MASKFHKAADAFRDAATAAASAGALEPEASAWFNLAMVQQQLEPGKLVSSVEKGLAVVAKAEEAGEAASVAVVKCELELLKAVAGLYESVVDAAAIDQLRAAQPECAPASAVGWVVANVGSSGPFPELLEFESARRMALVDLSNWEMRLALFNHYDSWSVAAAAAAADDGSKLAGIAAGYAPALAAAGRAEIRLAIRAHPALSNQLELQYLSDRTVSKRAIRAAVEEHRCPGPLGAFKRP
jgi:hypothetical protein